jgi:carboxyl-terminal processing protease
MIRRQPLGIAVALGLSLVGCGYVARVRQSADQPGNFPLVTLKPTDGTLVAQNGRTPLPPRLKPGPDDSSVAQVTAQLFSRSHYLKHPLDAEISGKFLDEYLNTLDPRHFYFVSTDLKEFDVWRPTLGKMLRDGDTSPANVIFTRLLRRVDEHVAYATNLLKTEKFTFDTPDTITLDRKTAPFPKDVNEQEAQWREYLRYEYLQEKLNKKKPDDIVSTLTRRYNRLAKTFHDFASDDVFEMYLNALAHAYDPHSDYMGKSAMESFNIQMRLSLFGIGALLQSEDGYCKIMELTPGGPAIKSGKLKVGDKIVAVAQGSKEPVDVVDLKIDKIVEMIRGQKGTEVRLTIVPADAPDTSVRRVVSLNRDEIKLSDSEAKGKIMDIPAADGKTLRLGMIDLPSFYASEDSRNSKGKSTTADVAKLIRKLKAENMQGLVLDLRRNPGGSLQEVIRLTGLFVKQGPVVQVKDSSGTIQVDDSHENGVLYNGPLIVLTSRLSASASEILAGALQDYGRALIVGDTATFGKGSVQTVLPLGELMSSNGITLKGDPGALKLTIQKFYRASGASTQLRGVPSDIVLPSLTDYIDIGEKSLDNAMPWDTVPTSAFDKVNMVQPYLAELKRRSDARIASDPDFAYLKEEIVRFRKVMAEKTFSLNEQQRAREKSDAEARLKKRKAQLLARPASKEKDYRITLANADTPGLPAPIDLKAEAKKIVRNADDPIAAPDTEGLPVIDTTLTESEHILADLISLMSGSKQASAARR